MDSFSKGDAVDVEHFGRCEVVEDMGGCVVVEQGGARFTVIRQHVCLAARSEAAPKKAAPKPKKAAPKKGGK